MHALRDAHRADEAFQPRRARAAALRTALVVALVVVLLLLLHAVALVAREDRDARVVRDAVKPAASSLCAHATPRLRSSSSIRYDAPPWSSTARVRARCAALSSIVSSPPSCHPPPTLAASPPPPPAAAGLERTTTRTTLRSVAERDLGGGRRAGGRVERLSPQLELARAHRRLRGAAPARPRPARAPPRLPPRRRRRRGGGGQSSCSWAAAAGAVGQRRVARRDRRVLQAVISAAGRATKCCSSGESCAMRNDGRPPRAAGASHLLVERRDRLGYPRWIVASKADVHAELEGVVDDAGSSPSRRRSISRAVGSVAGAVAREPLLERGIVDEVARALEEEPWRARVRTRRVCECRRARGEEPRRLSHCSGAARAAGRPSYHSSTPDGARAAGSRARGTAARARRRRRRRRRGRRRRRR